MSGSRILAAARVSLVLVAGTTCLPHVALSATKHVARTDMTPFAYDTSGVVGIGAAPATVTGPAVLQFQGITGASYNPAAGQPISLGQFVLSPTSTTGGTTTLYKGTPFEIEIQAPQLDKTSTIPVLDKIFPTLGKSLSLKTLNQNSVLLKGVLNGSVAPDGQANIIATVSAVKLGSIGTPTNDHITHYTFPIRFSQLKLPSAWVLAGTTVPTAAQLPLTSSPTVAAQVMTAQPQYLTGSAPAPAPAPAIAPAPLAEAVTVATPTPTPEPSTIVVFAAAFGGLVLARRRRRPSSR